MIPASVYPAAPSARGLRRKGGAAWLKSSGKTPVRILRILLFPVSCGLISFLSELTMRSKTPPELQGLEPKNGDFVAYLEKLQNGTLDALKEANKHAVPISETSVAEMEQKLQAAKKTAKPGMAAEPRRESLMDMLRSAGLGSGSGAENQDAPAARKSPEPLSPRPQPARSSTSRRQAPTEPIGVLIAFVGIFFLLVGISEGIEPMEAFGAFAVFLGAMLFSAGRKSRS